MVVRSDLAPGQQAVQAGHAALRFAHEHPGDWHDGYLIILSVADEYSLHDLAFRLGFAGIGWSEFWEPDLGDRLTAIAAGTSAGGMLRHLPLAFPSGGGETNEHSQ